MHSSIAAEEPISLETVLFSGKTANGQIFVVDKTGVKEDEIRLFISNDGELRLNSTSAGILTVEATTVYFFAINKDDKMYTAALEIKQDQSTRMALAEGLLKDSYESVLAAGEELTKIDKSEYQNLILKNLPPDIKVNIFAKMPTGEAISVIHKPYAKSALEVRLFIETNGIMREYIIDQLVIALDGGTTDIYFKYSGKSAILHFGIKYEDSQFKWADAYLKLGEEKTTITRAVPDMDFLNGKTYQCWQ